MFIHFAIMTKGNDENVTSLIVSTVKEASNMVTLFEKSDHVVAYKMLSHSPKEFGFGIDCMSKLRPNDKFRDEDWITARGD